MAAISAQEGSEVLKTFAREFSRPIHAVWDFMEKMGYEFSCKYPYSTGPEVEINFDPDERKKIVFGRGYAVGNRLEIEVFDEPEELEGSLKWGEKGRYTEFDELHESYDAVIYVGRRREGDENENEDEDEDGGYDHIRVSFVRLSEDALPCYTGDNSAPQIEIEIGKMGEEDAVTDFMEAMGFSYSDQKENPERRYRRYSGVNKNLTAEIWVTFYNEPDVQE